MKFLVTGAAGQVGSAVCAVAGSQGHEVVGRDRDSLDIRDPIAVAESIDAIRPDVVVNAAAWTAVDAAEGQSAEARLVNVRGVANLARACTKFGSALVHYSTDYVFDGTSTAPYKESDSANPINEYGRSKLEGEQIIRQLCENHLILRTSWIFSQSNRNFLSTMVRLGQDQREVRVVADQIGKPTSAASIAQATLQALGRTKPLTGLFHFAQPPAVTWYDFALAIYSEADRQGFDLRVQNVIAIKSEEFHSIASRPANSVLDCSRFEQQVGVGIPSWRDALPAAIKSIIDD